MPHAGDPFPQRGGRPHCGGCGIVQFVGQPGGEGAQGEKTFTLIDDLAGVLVPEEHSFEKMHSHRKPFAHYSAELVGVENEEARRLRYPHDAE